MSEKALRQQLNQLHRELATAAELDPELRDLLRAVAQDIEKLLGENVAVDEEPAGEELQARVQQATVEFEAEHPRLAHILGDLADTLTKLGI
jgi:hypothetical protein